MPRTTRLMRDRDYATFVEDDRSLLQRCAYLLVGQRAPADELVQAALAGVYARWRHVRDPRLVALRLLHTTDLDEHPAWSPRARFELVDTRPAREAVDPLVTLLQTLSGRQRMVVVLEWVARLGRVEIAAVLDSGVETVADVARDARAALVRSAPELADDAVLAARLDRAVPPDVRSVQRYDDLQHGQDLVRRRWFRRTGVAVAAVALLVLMLGQLRPIAPTPTSAPVPAPVTATVTATPSPTVPCDRTLTPCQASLTRAWRATVYEVVAEHLDPDGRYFNASSYYARDETDGLWQKRQGALAMEVFRVGDGSTQVYVQIATDRSYAPRCGTATGNACSSVRFMDGNRFTLSDGLDTRDGLEGQYRPDGKEVITVIAQDQGPGDALRVDRSQVVRMLQDDRLRLPAL